MPVSFLMPTPLHRYRRPWYAQPRFYLPAVIVMIALIAVATFFAALASGLRNQAATYDLTQLDQMESASVILDRNGKIFGQIYVENRQTVPDDQLPRAPVNEVAAIEDTKFYQHGGYDREAMMRAALQNFDAGN